MSYRSSKLHSSSGRISDRALISWQRIWFLAPTVELCIQQHGVLSSALPAYEHRLFTGSDNVDHWSEQRIWDAALDQCHVVVSTHAVLRDALQHGFVSISSLALLVFDEGEVYIRFLTEQFSRKC